VKHVPVLSEESLDALRLKRGAVVVDCTVGLGGHSAAFLKKIGKKGRLIAIDLDPANLDAARETLSAPNVTFVHGNFAGIQELLVEAGLTAADAIFADLGVSSPHLDDPKRGFSYRRDGPLDMRMDPTRGEPASALLDRLSEEKLAEALRDLGDEEDAEKIAALVVRRRPIRTTRRLMELVCEARDFTVERGFGAKLHPATRTFQALRMLVNRELPNLERLMQVIPQCLAPGGAAAVISFHSGEDRIVKHAFRDGLRAGVYAEVSTDPVTPSEEERKRNQRSRSAKLRWARAAE
jgi:16S rRNA (cytosine1402-N4)-methyltransferase